MHLKKKNKFEFRGKKIFSVQDRHLIGLKQASLLIRLAGVPLESQAPVSNSP